MNEQRPDSRPDLSRTDALMRYENWLKLIAQLEIDRRFQGKFSRSDVVQQTLLEAWRCWDQFSEGDGAHGGRLAWLRKILAHQLAGFARRYAGTQKRALDRELSIDQSLNHTSVRLEALASPTSSPSAALQRQERALELADLLARLPADYRQVIVLRNLEEQPHAEIAQRMNRSEGAVRMLWLRALAELKRLIDAG